MFGEKFKISYANFLFYPTFPCGSPGLPGLRDLQTWLNNPCFPYTYEFMRFFELFNTKNLSKFFGKSQRDKEDLNVNSVKI